MKAGEATVPRELSDGSRRGKTHLGKKEYVRERGQRTEEQQKKTGLSKVRGPSSKTNGTGAAKRNANGGGGGKLNTPMRKRRLQGPGKAWTCQRKTAVKKEPRREKQQRREGGSALKGGIESLRLKWVREKNKQKISSTTNCRGSKP